MFCKVFLCCDVFTVYKMKHETYVTCYTSALHSLDSIIKIHNKLQSNYYKITSAHLLNKLILNNPNNTTGRLNIDPPLLQFSQPLHSHVFNLHSDNITPCRQFCQLVLVIERPLDDFISPDDLCGGYRWNSCCCCRCGWAVRMMTVSAWPHGGCLRGGAGGK